MRVCDALTFRARNVMQQMLRHVRTSAAVVRLCCARAVLCANRSLSVMVATGAAALLNVSCLSRECEGLMSSSAASSLLQLSCVVTA